MTCPICRQAPSEIGALCGECRDELSGPVVTGEQIRFEGANEVTDAALIDLWGRAFRLGPDTHIGREVDGQGLQIFDGLVSRHHARVALESDVWKISDLASSNGTYVDGVTVKGTTTLRGSVRIHIAHIGFFFVEDASGLPLRKYRRATSETRGPAFAEPPAASTIEIASPMSSPSVAFVLHAPTGGGGCLAEIDGKPIQLTTPQHELITLLIDRMLAEAEEDKPVRGFVPMSELVTRLSLDAEPSETNVRQLVKRVRRALLRAGISDVIESRHGRGYRLRVTPRIT